MGLAAISRQSFEASKLALLSTSKRTLKALVILKTVSSGIFRPKHGLCWIP
jgi:hypothetical protein